MKNTKKLGFTLLELLIVVAIIGGLAAVVVVNSQLFRNKATGIEAATWMQTAELALEQYRIACEQYPPQSGGGSSLPYSASSRCAPGVTLGDFLLPAEQANLSDLLYFPIARSGDVSDCIGYHLGVVLDDASDPRLDSDDDINTTSLPDGFAACISDGAAPLGIDGSDPTFDSMQPSALSSAL